MDIKKLQKWELILFALSILSTFIFHMLYDWTHQNIIIGLIAPVSESVWEHTKLIFFPFLIYSVVEMFFLKPENKCQFFSVKFLGAMLGVFTMITLFYLYSGIIGTNYFIVDIIIGFISVFVAFYFSYTYLKNKKQIKNCKLVNILGILVTLLFFAFTFFPPNISLFLP